jgi:putative transposase
MKDNINYLNHSTLECKYHIIFIPKYRRKVLHGLLRKDLQGVFHRLAKQKECVI